MASWAPVPTQREQFSRTRAVLLAACCAFTSLPFLAVPVPPLSDLPQHVAQVRFLFEALLVAESPYKIQWLAPGGAVYALMAPFWALLPPLEVGRAFMIVLGALWTAGAHVLAWRRGRSAAAAVLSSALFFSGATYWGFIGFLLGWPLFLAWLWVTLRSSERPSWAREGTLSTALGLLLYFTDAHWLVMAAVWLFVLWAVRRQTAGRLLLHTLALTPAILLTVFWFSGPGWQALTRPAHWAGGPLARLSPSWLADAALGGLSSDSETVVLGLAVSWLAVGTWQHRRGLRQHCDPALLLGAAILLATALLLPEFYEFTLKFAARWVPCGLTLLLLGAPAPALRPRHLMALALTVVGVFSLTTTALWTVFASVEMTGLREAVQALPAGKRQLGLDFIKTSSIVRHRPFLHAAVYGQVAKGGYVHYSFAAVPTSFVVFDAPRGTSWTPGLEWQAQLVKPSDFDSFDYVLLNGNDSIHRMWARSERLEPVTHEGQFRLYRVRASSESPAVP